MRLIDARDLDQPPASYLPRAVTSTSDVRELVERIIADVQARGAEAVLEFCEKFDGVRPARLRVPESILGRARESLTPDLLRALQIAIQRVREVATDQLPPDVATAFTPDSSVATHWVPVDRVGLYVPGGSAVYPSSVVMNVVPAQVAGVRSLVIASPPQRDNEGWPDATILATCSLLGLDEVYAVGGAQAIAMLASGIELSEGGYCEAVNLITGPGNVFVTAAKRQLQGTVGIDSEAGPTEIVVLADDSANARFIAADLISQAEHDVLAAAVLITCDERMAHEVRAEVDRQVDSTKHRERVSAALAGNQSAIILVKDLIHGLSVVDTYAPEHLEIHTRDAREVALRVRAAGAVFVGDWSPVALGDYCAGSNHVLPTAGTARFSSGLSVRTFMRGIQIIDYDRRALGDVAKAVTDLANAEDLPGHANAITARFADE